MDFDAYGRPLAAPDQQQPQGGGFLAAFTDPSTQGLLNLASGLLQAGGPSPTPVSFGQALGHGMQSGLAGYTGAQNALSNQALQRAHLGLYQQQANKAGLENQLTQQILSGGLLSATSDPDKLEMLGARLAAAGHPGAATLIGQAEKIRANQQAQQAVGSMRSAPGTLGAGVTTDSPQGRALLSNLSGDPSFDQSVLAAQNDALNSNTQPGLPVAPVSAPRPGLFDPLMNSPHVGASARNLQAQLNATQGSGATPQQWLQHYERLAGAHQTAENQANARADSADLRRELSGANAARLQGAASDRQDQRNFSNEVHLANQYRADTKDFRVIKPQFTSAAEYIKNGQFNSSGDRALVFQFQKMLDPQDRVAVSDIKDIAKLGGIPERIQQAIVSLAEGKELPPRVRNEMFDVMRSRFMAMNEQQTSIEDEYRARATRNMLKPENVVQAFAVRRQEGSPSPQPQPEPMARAGQPRVVDFSNLPRGR